MMPAELEADSEMLSGWGLRQAARLNSDQLRDFVRWGLIPEPDSERRWLTGVVDLAIEVRDAYREAWTLPRRTVLLRRNYVRFPIPAEKIRQAMIAMAPSIPAGARKMKHLHKACAFVAEEAGPQSRKLPRQEEWRGVLERAPEERFELYLPHVYALASGGLASVFKSSKSLETELAEVPKEELICLVAVRHFAMLQDSPA